jgi:hypothetical protein
LASEAQPKSAITKTLSCDKGKNLTTKKDMYFRNVINKIRQALIKGQKPTDIENVVPIIVPRGYFAQGNWPGPYDYLRSELLGLTWTILFPGEVMVYVNHENVAEWERSHINWQKAANHNLLRISENQLWTREKRDADGQLLWAAMMHEDGLGSSRLLLQKEIFEAVGGKYQIGLPDRSCAIIVPESAGKNNMMEVTQMVQRMFEKATTPMLRDMLNPNDLKLQAHKQESGQ